MPAPSPRFRPAEWLILIALFCVFPVIGMARHPLWLDEALALFPVATNGVSMAELLSNSLKFSGSLAVTPLYAVLVPLWARMFPTSELALRCVNLPFLILTAWISGAYVSHLRIRSTTVRWLATAFVAFSPFYLYYSYDLRPYASMIAFGGMIGLGLVWLAAWEERGAWLVSLGFALSFLSQPTVIVIAPLLSLIILALARRDFARSFRLWRRALIPGLLLVGGAGIFYFYARHTQGSVGGRPDLKNVVFVLFEFCGFSGLGPTREQLRFLAPPEGMQSSIDRPSIGVTEWIPIGLAAILWMAGGAISIRHAWKNRRSETFPAAAFGLNALFFLGGLISLAVFFYFFNYRFIPRHICFLYLPFIFSVLALLATQDTPSGKWLLSLFVLCFIASSGRLLFAPRYGRDDFRPVVNRWHQQRAMDPGTLLWSFASPAVLLYYSGETSVIYVNGASISRWERIGPASFRDIPLAPETIGQLGSAPVVCLRNPPPEEWAALLAGSRGHHVLLSANRGTESDQTERVRDFVSNPATHSKKLPPTPFVESFESVVPQGD